MPPKPKADASSIIVDDRTGSDRLGATLARMRQPVTMERMEFGDVAFTGAGPEGRPVPIGIEYKLVGDALNCITDGRFAGHQLPGLVANYEVIILLLEGHTQVSTEGILRVRHPRGFWYDAKVGNRLFMYRELDHWLMTLSFKAGVRVIRTGDLGESAHAVVNLHSWWTHKDYHEHRSHLALSDGLDERVMITKPSLVRRVAKELPGVGWDRSRAAAQTFPTVIDMALADEERWASIPGIGKVTAQRIVAAVQGGIVK